MLFEQQFAVFWWLENWVKLLKVLEVNLIKCRTAEVFKASKSWVKPGFRIFEIINDFVFLLHLKSVIFCRLLNDVSEILHLLFIEGICATAFFKYIIEIPPKFFTNLHLSLEHHFQVSRNSNFVNYAHTEVLHIRGGTFSRSRYALKIKRITYHHVPWVVALASRLH